VSSTTRSLLIGSLIGAAVGGAIGWAYHEFVTPSDERAGAGLRFEASTGDLVKLGFAVIPLVRMLTKFFVPVDDSQITLPD